MSEAMHYRAAPPAAPPRVIRDPFGPRRAARAGFLAALVLLVVVLVGWRERGVEFFCSHVVGACVLRHDYGVIARSQRFEFGQVRDVRGVARRKSKGGEQQYFVVMKTDDGVFDLTRASTMRSLLDYPFGERFAAFVADPTASDFLVNMDREPGTFWILVTLLVALASLAAIATELRFSSVAVYADVRRLEVRTRTFGSLWRERVTSTLGFDDVERVAVEPRSTGRSTRYGVVLSTRGGGRADVWASGALAPAERGAKALQAALAAARS